MKKKSPLVLSTALLLLATSSYTFSQPYVFRAPAPGIKASLSSGGLPTLPDNGGVEKEQCELYEGEGLFIVFEADTSNADAVDELASFSSNIGADYANPLLGVEAEVYSGIIDNEEVYQRGERIFPPEGYPLNEEFGLSHVEVELYHLRICGDAIPPNWEPEEPEEPEDPTVAMCYEQYEKEEYKTATLATFGRESNPGPVFHHPDLFPSYSTVPETQYNGRIITHVFTEGSAYRDSVLNGPTSSYVAIYEDGKKVGVKPPWMAWSTHATLSSAYELPQDSIDSFFDNRGVSQGEFIFNQDGIDYYSLYITGDKIVKYIEPYYETIKSENYDWCIDNGYSTTRPDSGGGGGGGTPR